MVYTNRCSFFAQNEPSDQDNQRARPKRATAQVAARRSQVAVQADAFSSNHGRRDRAACDTQRHRSGASMAQICAIFDLPAATAGRASSDGAGLQMPPSRGETSGGGPKMLIPRHHVAKACVRGCRSEKGKSPRLIPPPAHAASQKWRTMRHLCSLRTPERQSVGRCPRQRC
jgi:hypothetical protein